MVKSLFLELYLRRSQGFLLWLWRV